MTQQTRPANRQHLLALATTVLAFALAVGGCSSPAPTSGSDNPKPTSAGRQQYADKVTATVTCDNGKYSFDGINGVYEITNNCTHVEITGSSMVVLAQNIDQIEVSGIANRVYALSTTEVDVTGSSNLVTWERGSPKVSNTGIQNTIVQGK